MTRLTRRSAILLLSSVWLSVLSYCLWRGSHNKNTVVSVACIGNSFQFVNDLPRVLETFGQVQQDSCLHGSLNFKTLTKKGNGMYRKWRRNATDFGACTIPQLLLGYDYRLEANYEDYYIDDGKNPCFQSAEYLEYAIATRREMPPMNTTKRRELRRMEDQEDDYDSGYDDDDGMEEDEQEVDGDEDQDNNSDHERES